MKAVGNLSVGLNVFSTTLPLITSLIFVQALGSSGPTKWLFEAWNINGGEWFSLLWEQKTAFATVIGYNIWLSFAMSCIVYPNAMRGINPEILEKSEPYDTAEGCLSLLGGPRPCKRYKSIKVSWQTADFQTRIKTFTDWPAQIIQHEIDHCNGILI